MLFLSPAYFEVFSPRVQFSSKLSIEFGIDGQTILTLIGLSFIYCFSVIVLQWQHNGYQW